MIGHCDICNRRGELTFSITAGIDTWACEGGCQRTLLPMVLYCQDERGRPFCTSRWFSNHDNFWTGTGPRARSWSL